MDLTNHKACIITCGVGGHYPVGVDRLERSLIFEGWGGGIMTWKDYPEGCPKHEGAGQYNFKVYAFEEAFKLGATVVLWCDTSLFAVRNPMEIFDYVNDNGLYFFKSGYSLAETATDSLCNYAGVNREELLEVSEFATGLVGINIENPKGKEFFESWKQYMNDGMFSGNRNHDLNDSADPVFKFSRQDQSAASMVLHKMGVKTAGEDKDWVAYKGTPYNKDRVIFFIGGL